MTSQVAGISWMDWARGWITDATRDTMPPEQPGPIDPGPVFIGDVCQPYGPGTIWLENWYRARKAREAKKAD